MFDILKFYDDSKALGSKLQIFHDSIVSQFREETWPESLRVMLEF